MFVYFDSNVNLNEIYSGMALRCGPQIFPQTNVVMSGLGVMYFGKAN
jgi:hypothetical protein